MKSAHSLDAAPAYFGLGQRLVKPQVSMRRLQDFLTAEESEGVEHWDPAEPGTETGHL